MTSETDSTDDDQLNRLLRAVDVPADLHEKLLCIANHDGQDQEVKKTVAKPPVHWQLRTMLVVAAGYLLVSMSLIFFWPKNATEVAKHSPNENFKRGNTRASGLDQSQGNSRNETNEEINKRNELPIERTRLVVDSIEEKLNQLELLRMESKLARLEEELQELDSDQKISIVLAVADQSALNFGASRESVVNDLSEVLRRYPGSQGAKIVNQFVNRSRQ